MGSDRQQKKTAEILKRFKEFKTIPSVAARLIRMIESDGSSLQEFESVIKLDPTLVLRLLKLVNSAYFALRTKIKNISEAVAYIGMENLRNMIVLDALKHLYSEKSTAPHFSREQLWLHSAAASICCQMISERIFEHPGEDVFLAGILHDIGIIVEDQVLPEAFCEFCKAFDPKSFDLIEFERMMLETDHPALSYLLIKDWGINRPVCEAVRDHHNPADGLTPDSVSGILQISEYLISRLNYSAFPECRMVVASPGLLRHMKENITGYRAIIDDLPDEMKKAREIYALKDTVDA